MTLFIKQSITELAVLGGKPLFESARHVGRPNVGNQSRFLQLVQEVLERKWFTNNGPLVQSLEQKIAELLGVKHCICMCNGTIALEIAIRACGLEDEVIVPSFTFIATAHALQWQQITPIFADIDDKNFTIDSTQIEKLITPRTTGIIGVHLWGNPCAMEALEKIAEKHGLTIIYDASHAFGCSYGGKMIGSFGAAEVFSFHATKFFNTLEGGAVVTNNDELAAKIRLMKNFGFSGYDNVNHVGTNGKMNEISAAMGLTLLESFDSLIETNSKNYKAYQKGFQNIPGVRLMAFGEGQKSNYQYIVTLIDDTLSQLSRDDLMAILHAENVLARRYFFPGCHRMEPYRSLFPNSHLWLPVTEKISKMTLLFPTGSSISETEIDTICRLLQFCVANASELKKRLSEQRNKEHLEKNQNA